MTYAWANFGRETPTGRMVPRVRCYPSSADTQFITAEAFLEAQELTDFHDEVLDKLTRDVNELFRAAERQRPDQVIGILVTPHGLFLAWSQEMDRAMTDDERRDAVTIESDEVVIQESLKYRQFDEISSA